MPYARSYGFKPPIITDDNYTFGGYTKLKGEPLQPSGDWSDYLPEVELQSRPTFDTNGCTIYGTLNALEILMKRIRGTQPNWSERFLAVMANSDPSGNNPHTVIEAARKFGLLRESSLPFDDTIKTWTQWASPKPMTQALLNEAHKFLDGWQIGHEWVPDNPQNIMDALTYSPLGVSVYAWTTNDANRYYFPSGLPRNHWCTLISYKKGDYWTVFDSYDQVLKNIAWDSSFVWIKRYYVSDSPRVSLLKRAIDLCAQLLAFAFPQRLDLLPVESAAPVPQPVPPAPSKIEQWAKAIEREEGGKPGDLNTLLKNPGNLKYGTLVATWGAVKGRPAKDGGFFAEFKTYEAGFTALCNFLTLACKDQLKAFHANPNAKSAIENPRTLIGFTQVYARPPNIGYANRVALTLGVKVDSDISTFL